MAHTVGENSPEEGWPRQIDNEEKNLGLSFRTALGLSSPKRERRLMDRGASHQEIACSLSSNSPLSPD
ncbi:hypothetical protein RRG08_036124 [Elysia crispata]|uniref:Uncharacterized protein n=1 Tax=Elysia crispata TaxID=231223 RepID=A0AAE1AMF8_9GAST|nr:hypothetical protein RRG08_036124 [Elysia crispata]